MQTFDRGGMPKNPIYFLLLNTRFRLNSRPMPAMTARLRQRRIHGNRQNILAARVLTGSETLGEKRGPAPQSGDVRDAKRGHLFRSSWGTITAAFWKTRLDYAFYGRLG